MYYWVVSMAEQQLEKKKKDELKQSQVQGQLTYDPHNPDPHRKRAQLAVPSGEEKPKKEKKNGN